MRFGRHAYLKKDPSIADIEADRHLHVGRIYNAMVRGDIAGDNPKSVAMKRWVREPHYPSDLVEAFAHKVFDCVLEQAKDGFRGWHQNDYVIDDRKGDDDDRDVDCAGRLKNVVLALECEKTICEDVMTSACQIRMFVNAPRAYANRKHQNRIGNSKRPKIDGKDESTLDTPQAKRRRARGGRGRGRSSPPPEMTPVKHTAPHQSHQPTLSPYFVKPSSQRNIFDISANDRLTSPSLLIQDYSTIAQRNQALAGQHTMSAISSSTTFPQQNLQSPLSPGWLQSTSTPATLPSLSLQSGLPLQEQQQQPPHPAPITPVTPNFTAVDFAINPWQQLSTTNNSSSPNYHQLSPTSQSLVSPIDEWWNQFPLASTPYNPNPNTTTASNANNLHDQATLIGVSLADIEQQPPPTTQPGLSTPGFTQMYPDLSDQQQQSDANEFSFEDFKFD